MCRHQSLRHRVRHHVTQRNQRSCPSMVHDEGQVQGDGSTPDGAETSEETVETWALVDESLEERLHDPLYLLLVRHVIFCRQIEHLLKRTVEQPQTQHRAMRRPTYARLPLL